MSGAYEVDAALMRDALSDVPGVEHVGLEFDGRGDGVLRVRLADGADEEQVVGAAVAGLRRRFGLAGQAGHLRLTGPSGRPVVAVVDTVPREPGPTGPAAAEREPTAPTPLFGDVTRPVLRPVTQPDVEHPARVVVERVEVVVERLELTATVHLRSGEAVHQGVASATSTSSGGQRAVATATARAVESAVGSHARLDVEAVDLLQVGSDQVGVVVLTLLSEGGIDRLAGSAIVRGDGNDAVVRATLDALNRRAEATAGRRPRA